MIIQPLPYPGISEYTPDDWEVIAYKSAPVEGAFDFTGIDFQGYQRIVITIDELLADTESTILHARIYIDGVLIETGYRYYTIAWVQGSADAEAADNTATSIYCSAGIHAFAEYGFCGRFELAHSVDALDKMMTWDAARVGPTGEATRNSGLGVLNNTGNMTGILFYPEVGSLVAGKVTLWGVPKGPRTPEVVAPDLHSMFVGALS